MVHTPLLSKFFRKKIHEPILISSTSSLVMCSTCFKRLDIPMHATKQHLKKMITLFIDSIDREYHDMAVPPAAKAIGDKVVQTKASNRGLSFVITKRTEARSSDQTPPPLNSSPVRFQNTAAQSPPPDDGTFAAGNFVTAATPEAAERQAAGVADDRQNGTKECCICLDATPTHIFVPCLHMCVCGNCQISFANGKNKKCPMCQGEFVSIGKVF